jgi:hypothetical protein
VCGAAPERFVKLCVNNIGQNFCVAKQISKKRKAMSEMDMPTETVDCKDIDDLVTKLFSKPPGKPCSVVLDVQETTNVEEYEKTIFRTLGQILTRGLLYKFGNDLALQELTATQIQDMKDYMRSVGFDVLMNEEIQEKAPGLLPSRIVPWILSLRHPPGVGPFFKIMFCHVIP